MENKIENIMMVYVNLTIKDSNAYTLQNFGSGQVFSRMLLHAQGFRFNFGQFQQNPSNWVHKLANIKLLIKKIGQYFEMKLGKGIKTNDINTIQIAKNNKKSEIVKMFQIVLATLTEAPNKDEHINQITSLDQNMQTDFVWLLQKIIQNRIIDLQVYKQSKQIYLIQQLQFENTLLQQQIDSIIQHKQILQAKIFQLQAQQNDRTETMQKIGVDSHNQSYMLSVHNQQLKNMVENLKNKLLESTSKHQHEVCKFHEEIVALNNRIKVLERAEETLELYKQKYDEIQALQKDNRKWDKQRIRLNRQLTEKQNSIKKLQEKVDEAIEKNYQHEEKEVYLMMEMQKKQIQFKELEKEIKKKLATFDSSHTFTISQNSLGILSDDLGPSNLSDEKLENQELKQNLDKTKKRAREAERENNRLQHKLQRVQELEQSKKKLQKMVVDAHQSRIQQLMLLISAIADPQFHRIQPQNQEIS